MNQDQVLMESCNFTGVPAEAAAEVVACNQNSIPELVTENSSSKEHWQRWGINRGDGGIMANAARGSAPVVVW